MRKMSAVLATAACLLAARTSVAQDLPEGTAGAAKPPSSGATELTKESFTTSARREAEKKKDATELTINAGGLLTGGNSRLLAATAGSTFRLRRTDDQMKAQVAANYGLAASTGQEWHTTVENIQGVERYDRFLGHFTVFLGSQQRHDKFQGLELRLQIDPGFGYYFVDKSDHLLWIEAGYDLRYDVRRDDALTPVDDKGNPIPDAPMLAKTTVVHSARAFAGYERKLKDDVKFTAGLEYIQSVEDSDVYRINGDLALTAKVSKRLAVSMGFSERFENHPLPGKQRLDTVSSVSLVYSIF